MGVRRGRARRPARGPTGQRRVGRVRQRPGRCHESVWILQFVWHRAVWHDTHAVRALAGAAELAQPHPATTTNVVVTTTAVGGIWYDLFEIYGSFPTPPTSLSQVALNCSPAAYLPQFVAANTAQVNIRMRHQGLAKQYCTVTVAGSLTHGPKRIWAGSCPAGTTACR